MPNKPYHILKCVANGVFDDKKRFFPYIGAYFTSTDTVAAVENKRYYVRSVSLSAQNSGAVAGAANTLALVVKGKTITFAVSVPTTFVASNDVATNHFEVKMLTDLNTALTFTGGITGACTIVYAEVEETQGEYL